MFISRNLEKTVKTACIDQNFTIMAMKVFLKYSIDSFAHTKHRIHLILRVVFENLIAISIIDKLPVMACSNEANIVQHCWANSVA